MVLNVVAYAQEIAPKYLLAEFDKILKQHEALKSNDFNKDVTYKRCVSEVNFPFWNVSHIYSRFCVFAYEVELFRV